MNRAEWQATANRHLAAAQCLLANGHFGDAYYLAGYSVECALKSCILADMEITGAIFETSEKYQNPKIHDIESLMKLANLEPKLGPDLGARPGLQAKWNVTKDWSEQSRYQHKTPLQAQELLTAITSSPDGTYQWIQQHW